MVISCSRRTDIPACYSDWLFNRVRDGYVYVRNPVAYHQISSISLSPEVVDGIVFWTKNPKPMLSRLEALEDYTYYVQFTLNAYGRDIERNLPSKNDEIIPTFQTLSRRIGKERVLWRYDPILLNGKYTVDYHIEYFRRMADRLSGYTETCTVSFLDLYQSMERAIAPLGITASTPGQIDELMGRFSQIAGERGIQIDTCAETVDLQKYGIGHGCCVDRERLTRIGGVRLALEKDKNQRPACGCAASIDIGAYNSCKNGCLYCYANHSESLVRRNCGKHDPTSPLLFGEVTQEDRVVTRQMYSCRDEQASLFEEG